MFFLRYYLWVAPHILLAITLLMAFRRGLHRRLPAFFAFAFFEEIQFGILAGISIFLPPTASSMRLYLLAHSTGLAISGCLQFFVIYELAKNLFPQQALGSALAKLLRLTLAALVLLAVLASALIPSIHGSWVALARDDLDFSYSLIMAGMLCVLLLFSKALHISWREWPASILFGFGISACINLSAAALRLCIGKGSFIAVDVVQMAAFHVAVLIWVAYFFLPERGTKVVGAGLHGAEIHAWNDELQRMVQP